MFALLDATVCIGDLANTWDHELYSQMPKIPSRYELKLTAKYNKMQYYLMKSLDF